jgi:tRNA 2-thiouridine synthesizing protein B
MLHIVNKSPAQTTSLASCLRLAKDGSTVLLIEDGVLGATTALAASSGLAAAASRLRVCVLQPDVDARGVAAKLVPGLTAVDYAGFVDLVAEHSCNQSWL